MERDPLLVRSGVKQSGHEILASAFQEQPIGATAEAGRDAAIVDEIERTLLDGLTIGEYVGAFKAVHVRLSSRIGEFLETSVIDALRSGELLPADLMGVPDPRQVGPDWIRTWFRSEYFRILNGRVPGREPAGFDPRAVAREIERSCYNQVVTSCKLSEEAVQRNWDSETFVNMYATRCGLVATNLDPESQVCRTFGTYALDRLLDGTWAPDILGQMQERDLNPLASEAEAEEIKIRSRQEVVQRTSELYKCPFCGIKKSTYREVQLRASDEPATIICKCIGCGGTFRGY